MVAQRACILGSVKEDGIAGGPEIRHLLGYLCLGGKEIRRKNSQTHSIHGVASRVVVLADGCRFFQGEDTHRVVLQPYPIDCVVRVLAHGGVREDINFLRSVIFDMDMID